MLEDYVGVDVFECRSNLRVDVLACRSNLCQKKIGISREAEKKPRNCLSLSPL